MMRSKHAILNFLFMSRQRRKLLREITDVQKRRQIREEEQAAQEQLRSSKFISVCTVYALHSASLACAL